MLKDFKTQKLQAPFMLFYTDNNATFWQIIIYTELIVSMIFNYSVCNIHGIHDLVIIGEESMKIWHQITKMEQNPDPKEGKWNNAN